MAGYFHEGKTRGPGCFTAPNGDRFYGSWNENHKRDGSFLALRDVDNTEGAKQLIEVYDDGQLSKRLKPAKRTHATVQWMPVAPPEFGDESPPGEDGNTATAPCDRSAHATAMLGARGEYLALYGGCTCGETGNVIELNDFWLLNIATMTWQRGSRRGTPPPALHGHTLTAISATELLLIGGQNGMGVSSSVYVYDLTTDSWSQPVVHGINFMGHTATLVGDFVFVIVSNTVFTLDLNNFAWEEQKPTMSTARVARAFMHHTAAAIGPLIYVHGGQIMGRNLADRGDDGKEYIRCSADLRVLDTRSMRWEVLDTVPPKYLNNHVGKTTGKGGVDRGTYSGVELGSALLPRSQHTLTVVDDRFLYIIGGWTASHPKMNVIDTNHLADVHIYDTATGEWSSPLLKYPICPPRAEHTATLVRQDEIWVLGGVNDGCSDKGMWELCVLQTGVDARTITAAPKPATATARAAGDAGTSAADEPTARVNAAVSAAFAANMNNSAAESSFDRASASAGAASAPTARSRWGAESAAAVGSGVTPVKMPQHGQHGFQDGIDDDDEPFEVGSGNILEAFKKNLNI